MSASFFSPNKGAALSVLPLLSSSFPQSTGASAWPPGRGFCVRGISDRKEWPSASVSVQHKTYQTEEQGIFFFLPWSLQSHNCYVYETYWYRPDAGKQLPHLFLFEDKCASILTLSTRRFPFFQTFEAGNLDSGSVFIWHYRTGVNKDFDPWGKDERRVQLRAKGGKMDKQCKEEAGVVVGGGKQ